MHKPTSDIWEAEYKNLYSLYTSQNAVYRKLKLEIRALHRKLRDANRGAERNAWIAHDLAKELDEYKIKHPEIITTT